MPVNGQNVHPGWEDHERPPDRWIFWEDKTLVLVNVVQEVMTVAMFSSAMASLTVRHF